MLELGCIVGSVFLVVVNQENRGLGIGKKLFRIAISEMVPSFWRTKVVKTIPSRRRSSCIERIWR